MLELWKSIGDLLNDINLPVTIAAIRIAKSTDKFCQFPWFTDTTFELQSRILTLG